MTEIPQQIAAGFSFAPMHGLFPHTSRRNQYRIIAWKGEKMIELMPHNKKAVTEIITRISLKQHQKMRW